MEADYSSYSNSPETYLQTNNFPSSEENNNINTKSKYGWVEVVGSETNVMAFCRIIVNDLTGKFELFQDETMNLVIFTIILGHPKILVVVIKDIVYIRSLTESCAIKCDSVDDAQSWAKFLCYPMFSSVPITKPSECDWLYDNGREKFSPTEDEYGNTSEEVTNQKGKKSLLQNLARQQIQFKIAELTRKKQAALDEKRKIKNRQMQKHRRQQILKQRADRIENNPKMKAKLESYRNRYDNIAELFRNRDVPKPAPPPPLSPGKRELELSKQKRLARYHYESTLKVLISNREQILREEMELNKQKLLEERQRQHEYSERRLLEDLIFNQSNGRMMTPSKQYEQMNAIVKIQALWRGATTRNYLNNHKALMDIQSEILSTIESAQKFQSAIDSTYEDPDQSNHSMGTFTSKAMKSLKEIGYEIPSYFYSPSKPHEKLSHQHAQHQSKSPRKGVTYYDPNLHKNLTQPIHEKPLSETYKPTTFSSSSNSHQPNFSKTEFPILQTNIPSTKSSSFSSPSESHKHSNSGNSTGTYDHSSINPKGWNSNTSQNEFYSNNILKKESNHNNQLIKDNLSEISEMQRMKLLTPVAETHSIKSGDFRETPPHNSNYYLERHLETSTRNQDNQHLASSASVISDLTDDFGEKGRVYIEENDISCSSSNTPQTSPQRNRHIELPHQSSESPRNVAPQQAKPVRNTILHPQVKQTNENLPRTSSLPNREEESKNVRQMDLRPQQMDNSSLEKPLPSYNDAIQHPLSDSPRNVAPQQAKPVRNTILHPQVKQTNENLPRTSSLPNREEESKNVRQMDLRPQQMDNSSLEKPLPSYNEAIHHSAIAPPSQNSVVVPHSVDLTTSTQSPKTEPASLASKTLENSPQLPLSMITPQTHPHEPKSIVTDPVLDLVESIPIKDNLNHDKGITENTSGDILSRSDSSPLKKSHSSRSMESQRSSGTKKSEGFGVYIGKELVAHAQTLEEIPILMKKITEEREQERKRKEAEESLKIGGKSDNIVTANSETRNIASETPNNPPGEGNISDQTDNNSVGSSKTAFEVWVGGKLIGIATSRDELPSIVAAAKAQEKLKRKLTKSKSSKKSLRSIDQSQSRSKLTHSESNTSAVDGLDNE